MGKDKVVSLRMSEEDRKQLEPAFVVLEAMARQEKVVGLVNCGTLSKAQENAEKGKYTNVEFRQGEIVKLPVEDNLD